MDPLRALHLFYDGPPPVTERQRARAGSANGFHMVTAQAEERSLEYLAQRAARSMVRRHDSATDALQEEVKRFRRMALACRERQQALRRA
jgi:hypothetical protein